MSFFGISMRWSLPGLAAACLLGSGPLLAAEPPPEEETPLQQRPDEEVSDDGYFHIGWEATISGVGGKGKTALIIDGEEGYETTIVQGDARVTKGHPATFDLDSDDHQIAVSVRDARGQLWEHTVDVPKGMFITLKVRSRYENRGVEGMIKNETQGCRQAIYRRTLEIEIRRDGEPVNPPIMLDPRMSAPGVRLPLGVYEVHVSRRQGAGFVFWKTDRFEVDGKGWEYRVSCD